MRSLTVAEAAGTDCKKELLHNPLGCSDGGDDVNARDVPFLFPFGSIPETVVTLTPVVPPEINPC